MFSEAKVQTIFELPKFLTKKINNICFKTYLWQGFCYLFNDKAGDGKAENGGDMAQGAVERHLAVCHGGVLRTLNGGTEVWR